MGEEGAHGQRRADAQVHLLLSRSRHGEVRLQQNRDFSGEKEWITRNTKEEVRSDFQLKYAVYTSVQYSLQKLPVHIRYSFMQIPKERPGVGLGGGAPVQGPGDLLKPLGTDLQP